MSKTFYVNSIAYNIAQYHVMVKPHYSFHVSDLDQFM